MTNDFFVTNKTLCCSFHINWSESVISVLTEIKIIKYTDTKDFKHTSMTDTHIIYKYVYI